MQIIHFYQYEMVFPTFLTDDFGTELQAIPSVRAGNDVSENVIVDPDSWFRLLDMERPFE